jgi:hypothetical protein
VSLVETYSFKEETCWTWLMCLSSQNSHGALQMTMNNIRVLTLNELDRF